MTISGYRGQIVLVILTSIFACCQGKCVTDGTTLKIREIILGRCLDYQENLHPDQFCDNGHSTRKNCTELTDLFMASFTYRPSCNISIDRFDDFIRAASSDVISGKALFWSGTGAFAHSYSSQGRRYITQEDTLIGYMVDKLNFCGQEEAPGINFDGECPSFYPNENCAHPAMYSFWASAGINGNLPEPQDLGIIEQRLIQFASSAQGEATVFLNGSRSTPFRLNSFFATWEVPNMNPMKMTRLNIFIINTPGHEKKSSCESDNIRVLTQRLSARNINYKCVDSPRSPQTMMCVDHPYAEECIRETTANSSNHTNISSFLVMFSCMSLVLMWM